MGELIALERDCLDFRAGNLTVWQSSWHGVVDRPKGGDRRTVPTTARLKAALNRARHLRGDLVFSTMDEGRPWTRHTIQLALERICRRAGLRCIGAHALRHIFCCSHLAMRGAAPKAIQELAGHKSLKVTMRYMHLTQSALRDTIRLLEGEATATSAAAPPTGTEPDSTAV